MAIAIANMAVADVAADVYKTVYTSYDPVPRSTTQDVVDWLVGERTSGVDTVEDMVLVGTHATVVGSLVWNEVGACACVRVCVWVCVFSFSFCLSLFTSRSPCLCLFCFSLLLLSSTHPHPHLTPPLGPNPNPNPNPHLTPLHVT